MNCEMCRKRPAIFNVIIAEPNRKTALRLCPICAKVLQSGDSAMIQLAILRKTPMENLPQVTCSKCGWTTKKLLDKGSVGCAYCYGDLRPAIDELLHRMNRLPQGGGTQTNEIETMPVMKEEPVERPEMMRLKEALYQAVQAENYELAAQIRDQMKKAGEEGEA